MSVRPKIITCHLFSLTNYYLEDGYHGNISSLIDASPKMHQRYNHVKKDHIHIVKLPDMFRGKYRYDEEEAGIKFAKEVENKIIQAEAKGRKIGGFLYEPMFTIPGVFIPPRSYYQHVFRFAFQFFSPRCIIFCSELCVSTEAWSLPTRSSVAWAGPARTCGDFRTLASSPT